MGDPATIALPGSTPDENERPETISTRPPSTTWPASMPWSVRSDSPFSSRPELQPLSHSPLALVRDFSQCNAKLWGDKLGQISLATTTLFWGVSGNLRFLVFPWAAAALGYTTPQASSLAGVAGAKPDPTPLIFRIRAKDGSEHWIEHVCKTVLDADGEVIAAVFDGNLPSLGGAYLYDGSANRAHGVDRFRRLRVPEVPSHAHRGDRGLHGAVAATRAGGLEPAPRSPRRDH